MKPDHADETWVEPPLTHAEKWLQRLARDRRKLNRAGPAVLTLLELFPPTLADLGPRRPAPYHQSYTVMKRGGLAGPGLRDLSEEDLTARMAKYSVDVVSRAADHTVLGCVICGHRWTVDGPCYKLTDKRDWVCHPTSVKEQAVHQKLAKAEAAKRKRLRKMRRAKKSRKPRKER